MRRITKHLPLIFEGAHCKQSLSPYHLADALLLTPVAVI